MSIGFTSGLALPNDNVSQFFHQTTGLFQIDSVTTKPSKFLLDKATSIGYTLGVKGRIELAEKFDLTVGIGIARFNQGRYDLVVPILDTTVAQIQSTANVVPISVGINAYLLKSFISLYATGDVSYNYISYSYDYVWNNNLAIPILRPDNGTDNDSRLGYGLGIGVDFDLNLFKLNLEVKFNSANIIGRSGDEKEKNYGTITLGIIF
jgi:opacity protein-like surface antigen